MSKLGRAISLRCINITIIMLKLVTYQSRGNRYCLGETAMHMPVYFNIKCFILNVKLKLIDCFKNV